MKKFAKLIGKTVIALFLLFIISVILALPVMWLWNWLLPDLFNFKTINVWQALGLNLLSGFLFKGYPSQKSDK